MSFVRQLRNPILQSGSVAFKVNSFPSITSPQFFSLSPACNYSSNELPSDADASGGSSVAPKNPVVLRPALELTIDAIAASIVIPNVAVPKKEDPRSKVKQQTLTEEERGIKLFRSADFPLQVTPLRRLRSIGLSEAERNVPISVPVSNYNRANPKVASPQANQHPPKDAAQVPSASSPFGVAPVSIQTTPSSRSKIDNKTKDFHKESKAGAESTWQSPVSECVSEKGPDAQSSKSESGSDFAHSSHGGARSPATANLAEAYLRQEFDKVARLKLGEYTLQQLMDEARRYNIDLSYKSLKILSAAASSSKAKLWHTQSPSSPSSSPSSGASSSTTGASFSSNSSSSGRYNTNGTDQPAFKSKRSLLIDVLAARQAEIDTADALRKPEDKNLSSKSATSARTASGESRAAGPVVGTRDRPESSDSRGKNPGSTTNVASHLPLDGFLGKSISDGTSDATGSCISNISHHHHVSVDIGAPIIHHPNLSSRAAGTAGATSAYASSAARKATSFSSSTLYRSSPTAITDSGSDSTASCTNDVGSIKSVRTSGGGPAKQRQGMQGIVQVNPVFTKSELASRNITPKVDDDDDSGDSGDHADVFGDSFGDVEAEDRDTFEAYAHKSSFKSSSFSSSSSSLSSSSSFSSSPFNGEPTRNVGSHSPMVRSTRVPRLGKSEDVPQESHSSSASAKKASPSPLTESLPGLQNGFSAESGRIESDLPSESAGKHQQRAEEDEALRLTKLADEKEEKVAENQGSVMESSVITNNDSNDSDNGGNNNNGNERKGGEKAANVKNILKTYGGGGLNAAQALGIDVEAAAAARDKAKWARRKRREGSYDGSKKLGERNDGSGI